MSKGSLKLIMEPSLPSFFIQWWMELCNHHGPKRLASLMVELDQMQDLSRPHQVSSHLYQST